MLSSRSNKAEELEIELTADILTERAERAYPELSGEENRSWYQSAEVVQNGRFRPVFFAVHTRSK